MSLVVTRYISLCPWQASLVNSRPIHVGWWGTSLSDCQNILCYSSLLLSTLKDSMYRNHLFLQKNTCMNLWWGGGIPKTMTDISYTFSPLHLLSFCFWMGKYNICRQNDMSFLLQIRRTNNSSTLAEDLHTTQAVDWESNQSLSWSNHGVLYLEFLMCFSLQSQSLHPKSSGPSQLLLSRN